MDRFRVKTPFCGCGDLRSVSIAAGCIYLIVALGGATAGFGYQPMSYGYGYYGENYLMFFLGISSVIWIISNVLLLHGTITKQHQFIIPWIYWQLVFVFIALMVLVWSSVVMDKLEKATTLDGKELKILLIAALSCVVPFLCTVIYFSIIVYSYYRDLKEVKHKEETLDTRDSPRRPVITVIRPESSMSTTAPFIPPRKQEENIYTNVRTNIATSNVRSATASDRQSNQFYNCYTLPDGFPDT